MPFDCTPVIEQPKHLSSVAGKTIEIRFLKSASLTSNWYLSQKEVETAVAVLTRARELISDEGRWCKGTLARGWLDVPVPVKSRLARRFCAIGAIERAGSQLGLPIADACSALEWQIIRSIPRWNDARRRTHADVVAAFDAAIGTLAAMADS